MTWIIAKVKFSNRKPWYSCGCYVTDITHPNMFLSHATLQWHPRIGMSRVCLVIFWAFWGPGEVFRPLSYLQYLALSECFLWCGSTHCHADDLHWMESASSMIILLGFTSACTVTTVLEKTRSQTGCTECQSSAKCHRGNRLTAIL